MKATRALLALAVGFTIALVLHAPVARAQAPASHVASTQPAEPVKDALGRETPRGTVIGFMTAARRSNFEAAVLYLNVSREEGASELAHQLYAVLDTRLPARLNEVSDRPEGSLTNLLKPDQDIVGAIETNEGPLDIVVERVNRGAAGSVWLFSRHTLDAIPRVYEELHRVSIDAFLPRFLTRPRIGGIRFFEWITFFVAIPLFYRAMGLFGLVISPLVNVWRRRHGLPPHTWTSLPGPVRLLLLTLSIRWALASLDLPLFERQFWFLTARVSFTIGIVWLGLLANETGERYLQRRHQGSTVGDTTAMLRLGRRVADVLVLMVGVLLVLNYFGIDPTAALAGLGIGGIAVALSAQKTLENVIGGLSIIFDKAVRVGDTLKVGDMAGTVEYIGLRSTRIRTVDRTIVSVPNGQIANVNIETLSARDKFRFYHFVGLGYDTSAAQMRTIVAGVRDLLLRQPLVDDSSIRARFIRLGPFSIDVEVFAYVFARDWPHFLEVQEQLLLDVMDVVERAGATIAFPTQTLHLADPERRAIGSESIRALRAARLGAPSAPVERT
ncbi:MAG TPA: mechanosensitive ion channel family protein [Vicinamibacterales bacterium]|nr:mechanosensitive ion channel family protein [Vicinamibacterales bacterium]